MILAFKGLITAYDRWLATTTSLNVIIIPFHAPTLHAHSFFTYIKAATSPNKRDSARCGHLRPLKVIRCCANRRGIYEFLLVLNSNLTSSFNRGTGKRGLGVGGHALMSVTRTLDYPTINWNPRYSARALSDYNARQTDRQTDAQTDEHHGNSSTIRFNQRIAR